MDAHEVMDNALKRAKQLAIDANKLYPQHTVEQYYNEFVTGHLSNPELGIKFTPHESRKLDVTPADVQGTDAKVEELTKAISQLKSENSTIKQELNEMKHKAEGIKEMAEDKDSGQK